MTPRRDRSVEAPSDETSSRLLRVPGTDIVYDPGDLIVDMEKSPYYPRSATKDFIRHVRNLVRRMRGQELLPREPDRFRPRASQQSRSFSSRRISS